MGFADDLPPRQDECHSRPGNVIDPGLACVHGLEAGPGRVALWGDSHALTLTEQLGLLLAPQGTGLVDFTYRSCTPLIGYEGPSVRPDCVAYTAPPCWSGWWRMTGSRSLYCTLALARAALRSAFRQWRGRGRGRRAWPGGGGCAGGRQPRPLALRSRSGWVAAALGDVVARLDAAESASCYFPNGACPRWVCRTCPTTYGAAADLRPAGWESAIPARRGMRAMRRRWRSCATWPGRLGAGESKARPRRSAG